MTLTGEVKHASKLPLLVGAAFLLVGLGTIPLAFIFENRLLFVFGYLATPISVLMCVAWDALAQRKGSRDPWFSLNPKMSLGLRVLAGISLVPAAFQIWQIAIWVGEVAVQNRWFE